MPRTTKGRLLWFAGLWLAGVVTVSTLVWALRVMLVGF